MLSRHYAGSCNFSHACKAASRRTRNVSTKETAWAWGDPRTSYQGPNIGVTAPPALSWPRLHPAATSFAQSPDSGHSLCCGLWTCDWGACGMVCRAERTCLVCAVLCVVKFGSVAFADEYSGTLNSVEEFRYLLTLRPRTSCACRLITCLRSTIGLTPRACRDGGRPGAVSYRNIKIKATFLWLLYAEQQRRERTDTVCWSSRVPPGPRNGARKHGCAGFPSQLCWCVLTPPSSLASAVVPLR